MQSLLICCCAVKLLCLHLCLLLSTALHNRTYSRHGSSKEHHIEDWDKIYQETGLLCRLTLNFVLSINLIRSNLKLFSVLLSSVFYSLFICWYPAVHCRISVSRNQRAIKDQDVKTIGLRWRGRALRRWNPSPRSASHWRCNNSHQSGRRQWSASWYPPQPVLGAAPVGFKLARLSRRWHLFFSISSSVNGGGEMEPGAPRAGGASRIRRLCSRLTA